MDLIKQIRELERENKEGKIWKNKYLELKKTVDFVLEKLNNEIEIKTPKKYIYSKINWYNN